MFHTQQAISLSLETSECRQKIACNTLCLAEYEVPPTPRPVLFLSVGLISSCHSYSGLYKLSPRSGVRFLNPLRLVGRVVWVSVGTVHSGYVPGACSTVPCHPHTRTLGPLLRMAVQEISARVLQKYLLSSLGHAPRTYVRDRLRCWKNFRLCRYKHNYEVGLLSASSRPQSLWRTPCWSIP